MKEGDPKNKSYVVGPGRPPREFQFKKGASGNPKGRPKGSRSAGAILSKSGQKKIAITEGGRRKFVTREEFAFRKVLSMMMGGDLKALEIYLRETGKLNPAESIDGAERLVPDLDLATKRILAERLLRDIEDSEEDDASEDEPPAGET